ncbi:hypothetical protein SS50377_20040 [Spironucleus salmonicida]|nr:hypothetical protein SS50377_20040 [Spironucleus salmonicida]
MTSINSPAIKKVQNAPLQQIIVGQTLVIMSTDSVVGYQYSTHSQNPIQQQSFSISDPTTSFLSLSKRDSQQFLVLVVSRMKYYYRVYNLQGVVILEIEATKKPYSAHAVEGTPLIAVHYEQNNKKTFTFETLYKSLKPVRMARSGSNNFFSTTSFFNCIRISKKAESAVAAPSISDSDMMRLLIESDSNEKRCYAVYAVHQGDLQTTYREYQFKISKQFKQNDSNLDKYFELSAEVVKELQVPVHCVKQIPIQCNASPNSMFYNSFALFTQNEMQIYKHSKNNAVPTARVRSPFQNGAVCFSGNIIASFSQSIQIMGVDSQWNDDKQLDKMKNNIMNIFSSHFCENFNLDDQSAKQYMLSQFLPQYHNVQQEKLSILNDIPLQGEAISGVTDGKFLILGLDDGTINVYSVQGIKNNLLLKHYQEKVGDVINTLMEQLTSEQREAAQQQLNHTLNDYQIQQVNVFTGAQLAFTPSRANRARSTSKLSKGLDQQKISKHSNRAQSTETPRIQKETDLSILRNSQLHNLLDDDDNQIPSDTLMLQNTTKIIEMGRQLASSEFKQPKEITQDYEVSQHEFQENINDLQEQLDTVQSELVQSQKQQIQAKEAANQLFEELAPKTYQQNYPKIEQIQEQGIQDAMLKEILNKYAAYYISSTQRHQKFIPTSPNLLEQNLLSYGQTSDLFAIQCFQVVLLECGHVIKLDSYKLALELSGQEEGVQINKQINSYMQGELEKYISQIEKCPHCKSYITTDQIQQVEKVVILPKFLMFSNNGIANNLIVIQNNGQNSYKLEGILSPDGQSYVLDSFGRWILNGEAIDALPYEGIRVYSSKSVDETEFLISAKLITGLLDQQNDQETVARPTSLREISNGDLEEQYAEYRENVDNQINLLNQNNQQYYQQIEKQNQDYLELQAEYEELKYQLNDQNRSNKSNSELSHSHTEITTLRTMLEEANQEKLDAINQLESLRFEIQNNVSQQKADQIVKRCLQTLGVDQCPKYTEELYRQLEAQCIALQSDRALLRNSLLLNQNNSNQKSLLSSSIYSSNEKPRKSIGIIIMGVIFGVILIVMMVMIFLETNEMYYI